MHNAAPMLQHALAPIEQDALQQPWAKERPWRPATHLTVEDGVLVLDLHDLKSALARRAVRAVVALGPPEAGAMVFVVGRGRHSVGPGGVLGKVVRSELGTACRGQPGFSVRMVGPARIAWITDRARAPASVTGGGGLGLKLLLVGIFAAFLYAVARTLGWA